MIYVTNEIDEESLALLTNRLTHCNLHYNKTKSIIHVENKIIEILKEYGYKYDKNFHKVIKSLITNSLRAIAYEAIGLYVYKRRNEYYHNTQEVGVDALWKLINILESLDYLDIYNGYGKVSQGTHELLDYCRSFIVFKESFISMFPKINKSQIKYAEDIDILEIRDRQASKESGMKVCKSTKGVHGVKEAKTTLVKFNKQLLTTELQINGEVIPPLVFKRVFTNDLSLGGRYYSSDGRVQCLPQNIRKNLFIDKEPIVEWDYSQLHASLCFTLRGIELEDDFKAYHCDTSHMVVHEDLIEAHKAKYELKTYDPVRNLCKQALLISLNSSNITSAGLALAAEFGMDKKRKEHKRKFVGLDVGKGFRKLCENIGDHNHQIFEYFFNDMGVHLQKLDSDITTYILEHFLSIGEVVLPYHDSYLCKESLEEELKRVMFLAYAEVMGSTMNCRIDKK